MDILNSSMPNGVNSNSQFNNAYKFDQRSPFVCTVKGTFENPIKKREQFAVSLRKQKTQAIIQKKRKKILQMVFTEKDSKEKSGEVDGCPEPYHGFKPWRKDSYREANQILERLVGYDQFKHLMKSDDVGLIFEFYMELLHNQVLATDEVLAVIIQLRRLTEHSNNDQGQQFGKMLKQTQFLQNFAMGFLNQQIYTLNEHQRFPMSFSQNGDQFKSEQEFHRIIKLELLWAMSNISHQQDGIISELFEMHPDLINVFNQIMKNYQDDLQMCDQLIEFLANSCGDSNEQTKMVLDKLALIDSMHSMTAMLMHFKPTKIEKFYQNIIWCINNICTPKNSEELPQQQPRTFLLSDQQTILIRIFQKIFLQEYMFSSALNHEMLNSLNHMTNCCDDKHLIELCTVSSQSNVSMVSKVIGYMYSTWDSEVLLALNILGNIVATDEDTVVNHFITYEGLKGIFDVLEDENMSQDCKSRALWCLSNICAGSQEQIHTVIDYSELLSQVIDLTISSKHQFCVVREATFVITNLIVSLQDKSVLHSFIQWSNCLLLGRLIENLHLKSDVLRIEILDSLKIICKLDSNIVYRAFKFFNVIESLEHLTESNNQKIANKSRKILTLLKERTQINDEQFDLSMPQAQNDEMMDDVPLAGPLFDSLNNNQLNAFSF